MSGPPKGTVAEVAPELQVARDLARRAVPVAALLVAVSAGVWGTRGAWSSLFSVGLVVLNFLAAAGLIAWGARISQNALLAAVFGGYLARMGVIIVALLLVKDAGWAEQAPLFGTLLVTHVGLLALEARYVSASLAYPGLKPRGARAPADRPADRKEALPS